MKFKIIILVSFSTLFHSEPAAPFCVCFSVRYGKHCGFSIVYENVNIIKKYHFLNKLETWRAAGFQILESTCVIPFILL